jgi:hypothetical protein
MRITTLLASLLLAHAAAAQTPVAELAKPPPTALRFAIVSTAGKHGESSRWTTADGMRMGRESLVLRGQVFEVDSAAHAGADGMLDRVTVRGFTPNGDAAESFTITAGRATWKSGGRGSGEKITHGLCAHGAVEHADSHLDGRLRPFFWHDRCPVVDPQRL